MTAWLGTFFLALAFCAALASVALWARAAAGRTASAPARWTAALPLLGAAGAMAALEYALVTHDFSVSFVAENGSRETPLYYTITSVWAAHDGSLLLWVLILCAYLCVVGLRRHRGAAALHGWAMAVLSGVAAFFLGLALFTGEVFHRVSPVPPDGPGPNPLLSSHPAMGVHPPLLYTGLVGMAVPFAFGVAGLVTGELGRHWLSAVRGYAMFAWAALTGGIVMGAWWSYAVLGWGGYWAWDPVENASLLPWLVATALLHSSMVQRRLRALPVWNLSLAVAAFLLSCLGTFLTRSGVISSVHSFADSGVGPVLLGFLVALAVGVTVLVLLRGDRLGEPQPTGPPLSRGSALLLNNVLLVALTLTVLFGTLYPLLAEWTSGAQVSVGPPYYNRMAVPIALLLLTLMVLGPVIRWQGDSAERLLRRLVVPVVAGALVVVGLALTTPGGAMPLATFGLATVVVVSMLVETAGALRVQRRHSGRGWAGTTVTWLHRNRRKVAGLVVHLGVALVAVGIAGSSAYTSVAERTLHVGDSVTFSGIHARLLKVDRDRDARAMSTSALLELTRPGGGTARIDPALRFFPAQSMTVAQPSIRSSVGGDVYVTLLSVDQAAHKATLRLAVNPMVGWIWTGGAVMVAGAALAMWPRRRRTGPDPLAEEPGPGREATEPELEAVAK
ncbi:MAG: heme lyase CcmF/NrfE family subunit [Nocardioidaceae bacterium]